MLKFLLVTLTPLLTTCILLSACSTVSPLSGSGNIITQDMHFSDFTSLDVSSGFEVEISQADLYRITIIADDNLFDNLEVIHQDDTLMIFIAPSYSYIVATKRAIITMPDIYGLKLSAGSEGKISGFQSTHEFQLDLSTGSQLTGNMNVSDADFKLTEGSNCTLDGSANKLSLDVSTGSTLNLEDFITNTADIKLNLGSKATINTVSELKADVDGGSSLYYLGNPAISDVNSSRGSSIQHK